MKPTLVCLRPGRPAQRNRNHFPSITFKSGQELEDRNLSVKRGDFDVISLEQSVTGPHRQLTFGPKFGDLGLPVCTCRRAER